MRVEDADLSLKLEDASVDQRPAGKERGIGVQVAGGKVVGTVENDIVIGKHFDRVVGLHALFVRDDVHVWVQIGNALGAGRRFGSVYVRGAVHDLALEIVGFNPVEIGETDRADSGRRQIERRRAAKSTGAHNQNPGTLEPFLSLKTYFRKDDVPTVSRGFSGRECNPFWHTKEQNGCCRVGNPPPLTNPLVGSFCRPRTPLKSVDGFSPRKMLDPMSQRFVVIMAGGKGERFWPQSRLSRPKQLLPIVGEKPMLAQTIDRLEGLVPANNIMVLTNREQREAVLDVCPGLPPENIVAEPIGRDTAAAVGLAAVLVGLRDPEGTIAMLPADHVIHDAKAFRDVLNAAFAAAESGPRLVTIGLEPTFPSSGFGYVQQGDVELMAGEREVFSVKRFVEKPDVETAKAFLESGDYLWNAGMFVWKVSTVREGIARHVPGLESGLKTIESDLSAGTSLDATLEKHFPTLEKISIDFALMQKAGNVVTLRATFDWDDVGSWPAVVRHSSLDDSGNAIRGDAVILEGRDNLVVSSTGHLVSVIGCDDLIVINTPGATLICPKDQAEKVKEVVKRIGAEGRFQHLL